MSIYTTNLIVYTGTDFEQSFSLADEGNKPLNLSGYTGYCYMKKHDSSLSNNNSFLVSFLDPTQGILKVSMGSTMTTQLKPGNYLYDIVLKDTQNKTKKIIEGNATIKRSITR